MRWPRMLKSIYKQMMLHFHANVGEKKEMFMAKDSQLRDLWLHYDYTSHEEDVSAIFETINYKLKRKIRIYVWKLWIYFLNQLIPSHLMSNSKPHSSTTHHQTKCTTWEMSYMLQKYPIIPTAFVTFPSSTSSFHYLLFYPISILARSPASQIQHHLRKCPFILHRFLILLPFALQYSFASSHSAAAEAAALCTYKCMLFSKWNGFEWKEVGGW